MSKRIRIRSGYGDYTDNFPYKQELARCLRRSDHSTIPNIPNPMSTEQSHIYALDASRMPWGDYGCILLSGMTSHLERQNGLLQLERTGPFVPPISLPGIADIVVTNDFKHLLEGSGLTGFTFQPVIKKHIVFWSGRSGTRKAKSLWNILAPVNLKITSSKERTRLNSRNRLETCGSYALKSVLRSNGSKSALSGGIVRPLPMILLGVAVLRCFNTKSQTEDRPNSFRNDKAT